MPTARSARTKQNKQTKAVRDGDQYFSRAVANALDILEYLQTERPAATLNDIAIRLDLSKTSAFRLLRTLESTNCLKLMEGGMYQIAPGVHSVTPTRWIAELMRVGKSNLERLGREISETISLAAVLDNRIEVIVVVESRQVIRMSNVVGHIVPPNASSLGKAITAFQSGERREKLLRSFGIYRFTEHSDHRFRELMAEFDRVREQRFAEDREESILDGICLGVPIFGSGGQVSSALSVSIPKSRMRTAERQEALKSALRSAADRIAAELAVDNKSNDRRLTDSVGVQPFRLPPVAISAH